MPELYNSTRTYNFESLTYNGNTYVLNRTASGSGSGTETSTRKLIALRTATGSGIGTQIADWNNNPVRQASGSGVGTETSNGNVNPVRQASGSGVGTETSNGNVNPVRQASGSGVGTEISVSKTTQFRTAESSGQSSELCLAARVAFRTGVSSGQSSQTNAIWTKSLIFRTPTVDDISMGRFDIDTPWTYETSVASRLLRFYPPLTRGLNVYKKKDGTFTSIEPMSEDVDVTYLGGHNNFVSPEEKADLVAAGYTVT